MKNPAVAGRASATGCTEQNSPPDKQAQADTEIFAPVPARAIADERLTALDLRVLSALAAHDRMGRNGSGCHASHTRLCDLVKCHLKSLSRSLGNLAELGYISAELHPMMKKLRVYRVIYTPQDKATS